MILLCIASEKIEEVDADANVSSTLSTTLAKKPANEYY